MSNGVPTKGLSGENYTKGSKMAKGRVPELTLGDRLMLARKKKRIDSQDMAAEFKKSRHTITNWEMDRTSPSYAEIKQWIEITGYDVDIEWTIQEAAEVPIPVLQGLNREQLARELLAIVLGGGEQDKRLGKSLAELDLGPDVIDLRDEPTIVRLLEQVA